MKDKELKLALEFLEQLGKVPLWEFPYRQEAIRTRGQALAEKSSEETETIVYKYSTLYGRRPND